MNVLNWTEEARLAAEQYRLAAVADGWTSEPLYAGAEGEERAAKLRRDGFVMQVISRSPRPATARTIEQRKPEGCVSIWGPDGLAIEPPTSYSWDAIVAGVRTCNACGAANVDTTRYSFAGRCCAACLPEMKRKHEYPGWRN